MGCQSQSRMRRVFRLGGEQPSVGVRTEQGVRVHTKGDLVQGDHSIKRGSRALQGRGEEMVVVAIMEGQNRSGVKTVSSMEVGSESRV